MAIRNETRWMGRRISVPDVGRRRRIDRRRRRRRRVGVGVDFIAPFGSSFNRCGSGFCYFLKLFFTFPTQRSDSMVSFFLFFLRRPIPNGGISQTVADWCRSMIGLGLVQSRSIITLPWTARPINSERKRENSVKRKSSKTSHCDRVDERGGFNSVIQSPDDVGKRQWPTPLR